MSNLTDQEVGAFVGRNVDYYLKKWRSVLEGPGNAGNAGNATGFNWAALLLSGLWLPYRKMYRTAAIFYGVVLLETLLEEIVYVGFLGKPEAPGSLGRFFGLIAGMVCGGFANGWYLSHTQEAITELRSQGLPEEAYLQALAKRGGTSTAASLGFIIIFLFAMLATLSLSAQLLRGS
ncbi:MAG: hypothetical protein QOH06_3197 [Acidobacteriota bacterium]|jgi:hypothetical protein|nr:hypothetical protein [Acidobacteriota bacterium]